MPRVCTISTHSERAAIDAALLDNTPLRDIAGRYGVSKSALARYRNDRLPAALAKAHEAGEVAHADDLLQQVRQLRGKAISILLAAEKAGDLRTALMGVREARACVELLAEMEGELNRAPQVNIVLSPEWTRLRAVIIAHLAPFPDARAAVASGLLAIEAGTP